MYKGQRKTRKRNKKRGFSQVIQVRPEFLKKVDVDKRGWSAMMLPSHRTPVLETTGSPERAWEESVFTLYFRLLCHVSSDLTVFNPFLRTRFFSSLSLHSIPLKQYMRPENSTRNSEFGPKIVALQHLTSLQHTHTNHLHTGELLPFITAV